MPGFDRTGPRGEGPLTGRGFGCCRRGFGFGRGFGMRFGRGRGFRNEYTYRYPVVAPALTADQEKAMLEDEMKILQEDMESIKKRIEQLEK